MRVHGCPLGAFILLAACTGAALAQKARVEIVQPGDSELRRTAYRLRMCPEEVRSARKALQEAHSLAAAVASETWIGELGYLWSKLDPVHAGAALQDLTGELRDLAAHTKEPVEYQHLTSAMQSLLQPMRELDPESVERCLAEWPEPDFMKDQFGSPGLLEQIRKDHLYWMAQRDPDSVIERLQELEGRKPDIPMRSNLMGQLYDSGREQEARALLNETLEKTSGVLSERESIWAVSELFRQAIECFPDQFPVIMSQLDAVPDALPGDQPVEVSIGDSQVSLSPKENLVLGLMRSLAGRPKTLSRIMELAPGLRTKLDPLGGLDEALSPRRRPSVQPATSRSGAQVPGGADGVTRPANPESAYEVMQAAQERCVRDPDRAQQLFKQAARLAASQRPSSGQAAALYTQVINACLQCEGSVSPELIAEGHSLVSQLREQKKRGETDPVIGPCVQGGLDPIDQLEAHLVANTAIEDFPAAMEAAQALRDKKVQFLAYMRIASIFGNR